MDARAPLHQSLSLPLTAGVSIGATLEHRRLQHRIVRLSAAVRRLRRIAEEAEAAGQVPPVALRAALQGFDRDLAQAQASLEDLERCHLPPQAG